MPLIEKITMRDGSQLLFMSGRAYLRWSVEASWIPFDQELLGDSPIPRDAIIECLV